MALDWATATLAPIPGEAPIHLRYFDTGVPKGVAAPYMTIIAIHGFSSNSGAWENSAALFAKDYRFLAHNRRGYEGSSDHYEGEPKDAVGRYMLDLAGFVRFAAEELQWGAAKGLEGPGRDRPPGMVRIHLLLNLDRQELRGRQVQRQCRRDDREDLIKELDTRVYT